VSRDRLTTTSYALLGLLAVQPWSTYELTRQMDRSLGRPQTMLVAGFLTGSYRLVAEWSDWAGDLVEQWPEDPAQAEPDRSALEQIARRARW
jgi:hypothetical protein